MVEVWEVRKYGDPASESVDMIEKHRVAEIHVAALNSQDKVLLFSANSPRRTTTIMSIT